MAKRPKKCIVAHTKDGRFSVSHVASDGTSTTQAKTYTRRWTAHRAITDLFGTKMKIEDDFTKPKVRKPRAKKAVGVAKKLTDARDAKIAAEAKSA